MNKAQPDAVNLTVPESLPDLFREVIEVIENSSCCCVWRGQSDSRWKPYPGLYRRLLHNGYTEADIDEGLVRQYEMDMFCESNGLGFYGQAGGNRLSLMVNLQHAGGATRLLDVTWDPFVALWFASHGADSSAGMVYCYQIDSSCCPLPEQVDSWNDVVASEKCGAPILITPHRINERIKAQSASFLTSVLEGPLSNGSAFSHITAYSNVKPVLVSLDLKADLRNWLTQARRMREFDLFPDFSGYAQANSQQSLFARDRSSLYDGSDGLFPSK